MLNDFVHLVHLNGIIELRFLESINRISEGIPVIAKIKFVAIVKLANKPKHLNTPHT